MRRILLAMSEYIHKRHNVTVLFYHMVFPAKYRRAVIDEGVDLVLRDVCLELERHYQLKFLEIGTDEDHVHFFGSVSSDLLCNEAGYFG